MSERKKKGATPAQVSLAWMLHKRDFIVPIPGMRRDERLVENFEAADVVLTEEEWTIVNKVDRKIRKAIQIEQEIKGC